MYSCAECSGGRLEKTIRAEHLEDLGGIRVKLLNALVVTRCNACDVHMTAIPDMQGLVKTVALQRALIPIRLAGKDIKFMRRALDMTQKQFAEAMDLKSVETVSRWENDVPGAGSFIEKTARHNICALLHKEVFFSEYDPAIITRMVITELPEGEQIEPFVMERVRIKDHCGKHDAWDRADAA